MAIHCSKASSNWALPLKVLALSAAAFSVAVALKASVPAMLDFAVEAEASVPQLWDFARSWLRPLYLYIVLNCIIIIIVASSKLQRKVDPDPAAEAAVRVDYSGYDGGVIPNLAVPEVDVDVYGGVGQEKAVPETETVSFPDSSPPDGGDESHENPVRHGDFSEMEGGGELAASPEISLNPVSVEVISEINGDDELASPLSRNDFLVSNGGGGDELAVLRSPEKPLVSTRFGGHRKAIKSGPEGGRTLRVAARPKRHDTLESTWKAITDGRGMPLTRHVKKSDTWETTHARHSPPQSHRPKKGGAEMKKSEMLRGGEYNSALAALTIPAKLRKEPSLSQDDLNRRVEAFIKKFNEDMRLQRQESLQQYQEMISRGAH